MLKLHSDKLSVSGESGHITVTHLSIHELSIIDGMGKEALDKVVLIALRSDAHKRPDTSSHRSVRQFIDQVEGIYLPCGDSGGLASSRGS